MMPAMDDNGNGRVEFFWRPGCPFCMLLERSLTKAGITLDKRNIWEEDEAAAKTQVQSAIQELDDVLKQFEHDRVISQVRKQAVVLGLSVMTQAKLKKTMGGKMDLSKIEQAFDAQREALLRMCGK